MTSHSTFDGPQLEEVLERVGRELGPDAVILDAQRTRRGGVGGFFAKEWFEVTVAAPDQAVEATRDGGAAAAEEEVDALLAMADAVEDRVDGRELVVPTFAEVLARAAATPSLDDATAPRLAPSPSPDRALARPAPAPAPVVPVVRELAPVTPRPLRDLPLGEMLAHLDRIVPRSALLDHPGAVTVVVGDLRVARTVAEHIAVRLGAGAADVVVAVPDARDDVAPWMRIDTPDAARARAARWRRGDQPVVVAVDLIPGREGHAWAAEVIAALDADQVRLVARAWQVTDELGPKAAVLGGVDGLELVDLDAAAEPEAFLELDLAVLGLDGRPATSEMWAALLMERRNDAPA